jgi:NAD(P)H-dependent FMN reductase
MRKVLTLSGSIRSGSRNQQLALLIGELARAAGGDVTDINLGDYAMPIFNEDLEKAEGAPKSGHAAWPAFC